jgi:hypothetical protein
LLFEGSGPHRDSNSQNGSSLWSVTLNAHTLSHSSWIAPLQAFALVVSSRLGLWQQMSVATRKSSCKPSCKTLYFFIMHILCILKTRIRSSNDGHSFINTSKYSYISIFDGHGLIMMYNTQMFLHSYYVTTCNGSSYISITFNIRTPKMIHMIYESIKIIFLWFLYSSTHEKKLIQKSPNGCLFVLEDFNIGILDDNNHKNNKQQLIYK